MKLKSLRMKSLVLTALTTLSRRIYLNFLILSLTLVFTLSCRVQFPVQ